MARQNLFRRSGTCIEVGAIILIISAGVFLDASAHAEPTAADKQAASALLAEGKRLMEAENTKGALEKFNAAHAILHSPSTAFEVAQALGQLGQLVEAREMVFRITQRQAEPWEPPADQRARADAKLAVDALDSRIPILALRVRGAPVEIVSVTIDGNAISDASLEDPRQVNPGKHEIAARANGYKPASALVDLVEGDNKPVPVMLTLQKTPVVEAKSEPRDKNVGSSSNKAGLYAGIGMAAGFALAGVGTIVGAIVEKGRADDELAKRSQCMPGCQDEMTAFDKFDARKQALGISSLAMFGGAVLAAGATGVYWATSGSDSTASDKAPRGAVVVTPTGGGLVVTGRW